MLAPAFVGEIAEVDVRGALSSVMQVMTMLGLLFTYILGALLSWRTLSWICLTVPVLAIPCLAIIPQSPIFLLQQNREDKARSALRFYKGQSELLVDKEITKLSEVLDQGRNMTSLG